MFSTLAAVSRLLLVGKGKQAGTPQLESEASVYYLQAFVFEVYIYVPVKSCFKLYDEA